MHSSFFFFNDTATTKIYTLSLHDALPISEDISFTLEDKLRIAEKLEDLGVDYIEGGYPGSNPRDADSIPDRDRKSTRLNSSHSQISYAVFCLKKKKIQCPNCDITLTYHRS